MKVSGKCVLDFVIGQVETEQEVIVADIESEGLLGSDFLINLNCVLNFKTGVLEIDGETVPYREQLGPYAICRVKVAETVTIHAGQEVILPGKLIRRGKHGKCGIIEPSNQFVSKHGILVGRTLVDPTNKLVPIRIMNLSTEPKTVHQDAVIGTFQPVESVSELPSTDVSNSTQDKSEESCKE